MVARVAPGGLLGLSGIDMRPVRGSSEVSHEHTVEETARVQKSLLTLHAGQQAFIDVLCL